MNTLEHISLALLFLLMTAGISSAVDTSEITALNAGLKTIGSSVGILVITYAGLRWIFYDNPQERDDAKKTIIYVMVGVFIIGNASEIVSAFYGAGGGGG